MAGELSFALPGLTGSTLYAVVRRASDGATWYTVTPAWEAWADAHYASYAITLTEQGTGSGRWLGTLPAGVTVPYTYEVCKRVGGSPAVTDPVVGVGEGDPRLANLDTALSTIAGYVDTLEASATTLAGYVDTLESRLPDALDGGRIKAVLAVTPPTAAQIDTQLSATHGSGPWGAGSGGSVSWPYVVTDGANPLQDVEVWVTAPNSDIVLESGRTDATGTYAFTLDPGTYWFYARMAGYTPNNPDVEVVA